MKSKKRVYFGIGYILFLVILFEVIARLIFSSSDLSRQLWANESISWKRSWVQRHKSTGKEIYFTFDIYDSTKGWKTKQNITDMEVFEDKTLNTNSIGIRGKTEYSIEKDSDKSRFFIIGDSFTFGEDVSDNETYPYYLQELLPNSEIMNFGVHGYGHDQMLISLKEQGPKYNPDYVILGFIEPDTKRNMVNFRDYAKPKFKIKKGKLILTSVPVPTPGSNLKWDWTRPRIIDVFAIIKHRIREKTGKYDTEKAELAKALLNEIVIECKKINAVPIFVYIPLIPEVYTNEYMVSGEKYLLEICDNNSDVLFFTTRPYLMNKGMKGTVYKDKGHWGPEGNYAIAEAIKQYLIENSLIK